MKPLKLPSERFNSKESSDLNNGGSVTPSENFVGYFSPNNLNSNGVPGSAKNSNLKWSSIGSNV